MPRACISKCDDDKGEIASIPLPAFRPPRSWGDMGPIIELEHIDLVSDFGCWMVRHGKRDYYSSVDASPLVASMRAYLMWEYGDEVPASNG